ncbi:hypothetical protein CcI49_29530 [Frankia sp. CcI49]|uniref:hypothetical protein n=1 Tax=unclassified Frankia TaxID=2632575 RepID=UPI0006CA2BBD|nr:MULTISPECIES: hypothetical protein [unclassified Frankia]KPM53838.1 hypothetical protein ACG83_22765 [Frankia sp. R43]ONH54846.1 hypothetical protein CcI49_29530 [Frankia sp. CcI49]
MLTEDDIDDITIRAAGDGRHEQAAAEFEDLAGQPALHGEISATTLLVHAGGQYGLARRWDEAVRCYRAALVASRDSGREEFDPRVWLHDALLRWNSDSTATAAPVTDEPDRGADATATPDATERLERATEATALLAEIKASRPRDPDVYAAVAETLAEHDQLVEAHTWYTMGFQRCQRADVPEYLLQLLLVGRRTMRRKLDYPLDELDLIADAYVDHQEQVAERSVN